MLERNVLAVNSGRGPRFETVGGRVFFTFVIDPTNAIGPRLATQADYDRYPGEWAAFQAAGGHPEPQARPERTLHVPDINEDPDAPPGAPQTAAGHDPAEMSRQSLMKVLTSMGVSYPNSANRDELAVMLAEAQKPKA